MFFGQLLLIMMGVDQTYIIVLDTVLFETTHLYYSFEANISTATCSAYVIAVNRAGESDPIERQCEHSFTARYWTSHSLSHTPRMKIL